MNTILKQIEEIGIVPTIKIEDAEKAVPLARALVAGGIPCAEITFRTTQAEAAIGRIAAEVPDILLGAGTVLSTEQVDRAIGAGAKFIVAPGLNPKVVSHCLARNVPVTPGCSTPSDIEQALEFGLEAVKFFPAEQAGGLDYIKAVSAPYNTMKFLPTGGIHKGNITKYLAFDKVFACGGSWMVPPALINAGDFDAIRVLCREAVEAVMDFELVHVGINAENKEEAVRGAKMFEALFGFAFRETPRSVFAGKGIEIMNTPFLGKHGHIAVGTNSLKRAQAYLERKGIEFNPDTLYFDEVGKPLIIYMKDEIAGFAVHLFQK